MSFVTIYKTFWGEYIDFDTVISISSARFIDRMGSGGWFVGFTIKTKNGDLEYSRELCHYSEMEFRTNQLNGRMDGQHYLKMVNGSSHGNNVLPYANREFDKNILACANLQKQIDQIVEDWILWKKDRSNVISKKQFIYQGKNLES
jgi:hypothetical protein